MNFAATKLSQQKTPCKACTVCSAPIQWRRRLAADWEKVLYCSAACRRIAAFRAKTGRIDRVEVCGQYADDSIASAA